MYYQLTGWLEDLVKVYGKEGYRMKSLSGERVFFGLNYILTALIALSCILPIVHVVAVSLSHSQAITSGKVFLWPIQLNIDSYRLLFDGTPIIRAFNNSVTITVVGIVLSMLGTTITAYALSRPNMPWRKAFTLILVFTMLFNGGIIPTYLVVKSLSLINTYGAIWFTMLLSTYNVLVMKTFLEGLPSEVYEAGTIDGCSEFRLFYSIALPLSKPVIAALSLFYGVSYWNAYMPVLIYVTASAKQNMTVLVQQMIKSQTLMDELASQQLEDIMMITPEGVKSAAVVIMILPMLIVYPFVQKYFVKGVLIGAIKS